MGPACKIIINQATRSLSESMERILVNPDVLAGRMDIVEASALLERLTKLDLACVDGAASTGDSLLKILAVLVDRGIVTDEVWRVYAKAI